MDHKKKLLLLLEVVVLLLLLFFVMDGGMINQMSDGVKTMTKGVVLAGISMFFFYCGWAIKKFKHRGRTLHIIQETVENVIRYVGMLGFYQLLGILLIALSTPQYFTQLAMYGMTAAAVMIPLSCGKYLHKNFKKKNA